MVHSVPLDLIHRPHRVWMSLGPRPSSGTPQTSRPDIFAHVLYPTLFALGCRRSSLFGRILDICNLYLECLHKMILLNSCQSFRRGRLPLHKRRWFSIQSRFRILLVTRGSSQCFVGGFRGQFRSSPSRSPVCSGVVRRCSCRRRLPQVHRKS